MSSSLLCPCHSGLNFTDMIKGASFVASNCAYHLRNSLVVGLRDMGFRVDGLGQCLHTQNITEGVSLDIDENEDILSDYKTKKHVLSKYMFHLGDFSSLFFNLFVLSMYLSLVFFCFVLLRLMTLPYFFITTFHHYCQLAFENDIESWHVTEKAYHALHAGDPTPLLYAQQYIPYSLTICV